jgi:DNA modification methylase
MGYRMGFKQQTSRYIFIPSSPQQSECHHRPGHKTRQLIGRFEGRLIRIQVRNLNSLILPATIIFNDANLPITPHHFILIVMAKKTARANPTEKPAADTPKAAIASLLSAPAGRPSALLDTRVVYCGDCLEQLRKLPDACVDLIYIDPPFNSNRNYEVFWGETKEKRAFEDRHASTQAYIDYMRPRCVELSRVLKKTGSFYYHCDWHASHYVKIMLDQIFSENMFRNEIIWRRTQGRKSERQWPRVHDCLFFYTGGTHWTWNAQTVPHDEETVKGHDLMEDDGGVYRLSDLSGAGQGPPRNFGVRGQITPSKGRHWMFDQEGIDRLIQEGRVEFSRNGTPRLKTYLQDLAGVDIADIWMDIEPINASAAERLGYPTQKPLALLERIINASSNPNDIVLDGFCGCGTALVAAQNLGRQWIGIDISPTACRVMAKRLRDVCKIPENEKLWRIGRGYVVRDLPWTVEKLRALPHFEFENWAVIALGGIPNKVQVGDMGVDGRIFPVGTKPADEQSMFANDWFPIQVKQVDKVGRPDIDAFEAVMEREGEGGRQRGFFVAFGYSRDAEQECAAFHKRTGRIIKLLTVQEILDEEHVQKM